MIPDNQLARGNQSKSNWGLGAESPAAGVGGEGGGKPSMNQEVYGGAVPT